MLNYFTYLGYFMGIYIVIVANLAQKHLIFLDILLFLSSLFLLYYVRKHIKNKLNNQEFFVIWFFIWTIMLISGYNLIYGLKYYYDTKPDDSKNYKN